MKKLTKSEVIETILNQNLNDILQLEISIGYILSVMQKKGKLSNKTGFSAELAKQQGTLKDKKAYVKYLEDIKKQEEK